jgi:nicotinate-nucleotide adenylyltransferase
VSKEIKKTGLFFGTFNPIHVGHLIIASYMQQFTDLDEVWFVVSPHNPLKEKKSLLADIQRLQMVSLAVDEAPGLKASNVEFGLLQPSYTINTLAHLGEKYPDKTFALIMGEDNLQHFSKWKNYEQIIAGYELYVYPRRACDPGEWKDHPRVTITEAPIIELSSTFIRQAIKDRKDIRFMLPAPVYNYIEEMGFYRK